ncbi:hypothetical protein SLA2020_303740 [Shorea laevis]
MKRGGEGKRVKEKEIKEVKDTLEGGSRETWHRWHEVSWRCGERGPRTDARGMYVPGKEGDGSIGRRGQSWEQ